MRIIPPKHLDAIGKETWKKLAHIVQPDEKTSDILALFCDGVSSYRQSMEQLETLGRVQTSTGGIMRLNPWVAIQKQSATQVIQAARALGLDAKQVATADELDDFLNNQGANVR